LLTKDGKPGKTYTWEFLNTITNRWYLIKDKAIIWHDGRIVRLEIATDITESKEAEIALQESEERFRTTFNQAIDSIFIVEISDNEIPKIHDVNKTVIKKLGYTKKELIGKPMNSIHIDEKKETIQKRVKSLLAGNQEIFETIAKKKDGTFIPIELSAKRIKINNKYFLYIIERDITEQKKREKEILEVQKKLVEENANKDKFFSIISHDLKSPFGSILGITDLLVSNYNELSSEEIKEMVILLQKSSVNVYKLLEGLLVWAQTQTGRMEYKFEKINIYEKSVKILNFLKQNALRKNILLKNLALIVLL